jgi:hypothetical protein
VRIQADCEWGETLHKSCSAPLSRSARNARLAGSVPCRWSASVAKAVGKPLASTTCTHPARIRQHTSAYVRILDGTSLNKATNGSGRAAAARVHHLCLYEHLSYEADVGGEEALERGSGLVAQRLLQHAHQRVRARVHHLHAYVSIRQHTLQASHTSSIRASS